MLQLENMISEDQVRKRDNFIEDFLREISEELAEKRIDINQTLALFERFSDGYMEMDKLLKWSIEGQVSLEKGTFSLPQEIKLRVKEAGSLPGRAFNRIFNEEITRSVRNVPKVIERKYRDINLRYKRYMRNKFYK